MHTYNSRMVVLVASTLCLLILGFQYVKTRLTATANAHEQALSRAILSAMPILIIAWIFALFDHIIRIMAIVALPAILLAVVMMFKGASTYDKFIKSGQKNMEANIDDAATGKPWPPKPTDVQKAVTGGNDFGKPDARLRGASSRLT